MYKKAAIIVLDECIKSIEGYASKNHNMPPGTQLLLNSLKNRAITGINIAKRLLEEDAPQPEIHVFEINIEESRGEENNPSACPVCGNEEVGQGDKFCKICGAPTPEKEAEF